MQQPNFGPTVQEIHSFEALKTLFTEIKRSFDKNLEQESCVMDFNLLIKNLMTFS